MCEAALVTLDDPPQYLDILFLSILMILIDF
jgi:hypothetical protein